MELKPCPFCGGKAGLSCHDYVNGYIVAGPYYVIECEAPADQCQNYVSMKDKDCDRLIASWNRRADLSSPLGAVAMREAAAAIVGPMASSNSPYAANAGQSAYDAIRAIPLPTHAALLAAALALPEVAALVAFAHSFRGRLDVHFVEDREMADEIDPILAALEARHG